MKKILIFGYFGYNNFGDELLLKAILKMINKFSDSSVYVLYNPKNIYKFVDRYVKNLSINVTLISRWNFLKIIRIILNVDTVICSGGLFQDKTSDFSLFYYLTIIKISKLFNKKVLILGTEFDVKKCNKKFLTSILEKVDYIGVRNKVDVNNMKLLSKKIIVNFFPDLSFVLYEKKISNNKKNVLGLILKSPDKKSYNEEVNKTIDFCKKISAKHMIYLIPLHLGTDMFSEDYLFALKIFNKIERSCIKVWDNIEGIKNIFEETKSFIVSRFHGIIMCLMLRKKFVCVSESMKLINFMKDIEMCNNTVSTYDKIDIFRIEQIEKTSVDSFENICIGYKNKLEEIFLSFKQKEWI